MPSPEDSATTELRVIDAFDHPHGARILRTRLTSGAPPRLEDLRKGRLRATGPDGSQTEARVVGFPLFGGHPSNDRIEETGRVDLVLEDSPDAAAIDRMWKLRLDR